MARGNDGLKVSWGLLLILLSGCSALIHPEKNITPSGTRLTLPSHYDTYYSSPKARYLGEVHGRNLERLMDGLTQGPIGQSQFANPVVSLSMGFFTYANSQPPDQRYLEVILGMPDILDENSDLNVNVSQLFSQYGRDVLTVLASDRAIATDNKIAGYGLNFSWRSMTVTPSGPRMTLNEVVIYIDKEQTEKFLHRQVDQNALLRGSTLFFRKGEQPAKKVAYVVPSIQPGLQIFTNQSAPIRLQQDPSKGKPTFSPTTDVPAPQAEPSSLPVETSKEAAPTLEPRVEAPPQNPVVAHENVAATETLFTTPQEPAPGSPSATPRAEQGPSPSRPEYLVQLWYAEEEEAQRWVNLLGAGRYTTAIEIVDGSLPVRLRVGRFASLVDATHFLEHFKAHGAQGQILQVER